MKMSLSRRPLPVALLCQHTEKHRTTLNQLIINPIERLVDLVRKISANPLGVEYKMLGEKEGFKAGMETTILLTTINRIGGLMQVVGLGTRFNPTTRLA